MKTNQSKMNPPPPPKKMSVKDKGIYPNQRRLPKNKMSAKKIVYYQFHTLNTQCMSDSIPLPIRATVSIFTVSAFIFFTLTPNIPILFAAIPQHFIIILIQCTGYTALLRTLHHHFWWDALPCHYDPHALNNTFVFPGLLAYLSPWRLEIFSTHGVSGVKNLNTCVLDFSVVSAV